MDGNLSAADMAAVTGREGNWGEGLWLFAILALMGGGFGNWGNRGGYEQYATRDQVQNGFDTQNLQAQTRDILMSVNDASARGLAATNQVYHDVVDYVGDKYMELQRDIAALAVGQANVLANQNQCCCSLQRAIDGVNYNTAM